MGFVQDGTSGRHLTLAHQWEDDIYEPTPTKLPALRSLTLDASHNNVPQRERINNYAIARVLEYVNDATPYVFDLSIRLANKAIFSLSDADRICNLFGDWLLLLRIDAKSISTDAIQKLCVGCKCLHEFAMPLYKRHCEVVRTHFNPRRTHSQSICRKILLQHFQ